MFKNILSIQIMLKSESTYNLQYEENLVGDWEPNQIYFKEYLRYYIAK